ncbi:MAG TPA: tetratricopeptide repeat protein [Verrucomicrobiae bacterium]|nr:tetratricopeptide repeat protein [Verrucomicrobiae bacterium]
MPLKPRLFIPILIVAAGIWVYHNTFQGPFILDDIGSIVQNPTIRHLSPLSTVLSPSPKSLVGGRPVVNLSFALNYAWGRMHVRGYHAFNLAVHLLAALALFGIVRRTLLRQALRERFGTSAPWIAAAIAVIWTVHPIQTEAVTYISQRCESLMGLFYLLTLYAFIRGVESRSQVAWFTLAAIACFLGMATKEVMVTAPLLVLLYDRTFVSGSFREAWTRRWRLYLGLAGSWLLLAHLMAGLHNRSVGYGLGSTWWGYALTECRVIVEYLRLTVWPHPLIFDYGEYVPIEHSSGLMPYAAMMAVLVAIVVFELKRHPSIGFVGAWFFVILAPTSSVVPVAGSPMAEHRMYLPILSVITFALVGSFVLGRRFFHGKPGLVLGLVAAGTVAGLCAFLTIQRNDDYKSAVAIWQDTVNKRPNNARAQSNLGTVLFQAGRAGEAIGHLERALRIKPDYADAHYNLGLALVRLGRTQEAIAHFHSALRIKPDYADAYDDLGLALEQTGRAEDAISQYEQAIRIKPDFVDAHNNLAVALARQGRVPEAIEHWEQALLIDPGDADAHCNLGLALMGQSRIPEAIDHYEQALRINPGYAEAHNDLGVALEQQGRVRDAIEQYEAALRIKPDFVQAQANLARARPAR